MNTLDRIFVADAAAYGSAYIEHLSATLRRIDPKAIQRFVDLLLDARRRGATIYFVGNGGSASTASHFANDLAIGTRSLERPFRVMSLSDNAAVMTAIGNDFGYQQLFAMQVRAVGKAGDVLVLISASGNSPNLVEAVTAAKDLGMTTFALTAFDGGRLRELADDSLHVPTEPGEYGPAEDGHLVINHIVGTYLMRAVKAE